MLNFGITPSASWHTKDVWQRITFLLNKEVSIRNYDHILIDSKDPTTTTPWKEEWVTIWQVKQNQG